MIETIAEILERAERENKSIAELMIEQEQQVRGSTRYEIIEGMKENLRVMKAATEQGAKGVTS